MSATDVWAVGNLLPDTAGANQDAAQSLAAHVDGGAVDMDTDTEPRS